MRLTTVIIGDDPAAIERSAASVRADGDSAIEVRVAADPAPWSGVNADAVWLLRAGDRATPGGRAALETAIAANAAVIGGHRVGCTGRWDEDVLPARDAARLVPAAISVDGTLELSALAVRLDALPAFVRVPPTSPGGDLGLLCELARRTLTPLLTVVADVRCRPEHHGDATAVLDRLAGTLASSIGEDRDHARRIRRRALSVAYLDAPEGGPTIAPDRWWSPLVQAGDAERILDLLVDLHWVLGRSAEEARLLRGGFDAYIEDAPADQVVIPGMDVSDLHNHLAFLQQQIAERSATANWLHEEVLRRDQAIAALDSAAQGAQVELARIDQVARDRHEAIESMHAELVRQNEEVHRLYREVQLRDHEVEQLARKLDAAAAANDTLRAEARRGIGPTVRRLVGRLTSRAAAR